MFAVKLLPEIKGDILNPNIANIPEEFLKKDDEKIQKEIRHEPPQPVEPEEVPLVKDAPTENILNEQKFIDKENPIESDALNNDIKKEVTVTHKQNANLQDSEIMISKPNVDQIEIKIEKLNNIEGNSKIMPENLKKNISEINIPSKVKKLIIMQKASINATKPSKIEEVDSEAIKKEENEILEEEKLNKKGNLDTLVVQQKLVEVQKQLDEIKSRHESQKQVENEINKKVNEEKLKAVKAIENIAKKAIESLTNNDEKFPIKHINEPIAVNELLVPLPKKNNKTEASNVIKNTANLANKIAKDVLNVEKYKIDNKNNKTLVGIVNAAPLSYQLGLNLKVPLANNQQEIKLKRFVPIPLAEKYVLKNITNITQNSVNVNQNENLTNITKHLTKEHVESKNSVHINENQNGDIHAIRRDILSDKTNQREKRNVDENPDENEACEKRSSN